MGEGQEVLWMCVHNKLKRNLKFDLIRLARLSFETLHFEIV